MSRSVSRWMEGEACECGREPTFDSVDTAYGGTKCVIDNGQTCLNCDAFYCDDCSSTSARGLVAYDSDYCRACNAVFAAAAAGASGSSRQLSNSVS